MSENKENVDPNDCRRKRQVVSLKRMEYTINSVPGNGKSSITIENLVDLSELPPEFVYTNEYIAGSGVTIPEEPAAGCQCSSCYSSGCCPFAKEEPPAYTKNGRIKIPPGTRIIECNKRCQCDQSNCSNRVIQNGPKVNVCLFKTADGRGWGVKTSQRIPKGTFVARFAGEVITWAEAQKRSQNSDVAPYLFDLDYNTAGEENKRCPYTVDASKYGNISRFFNHSCNPNLDIYCAWVNCTDEDLHLVAFFAKRDIASHEELTIDYGSENSDSSEEESPPPDGNVCKCGTTNCRGFF